MSKYGIYLIDEDGDRDEQDEVFSSEEEAEDYAIYLQGCSRLGAEILHMSNPGDYLYDENDFEAPDYEIFEIED